MFHKLMNRLLMCVTRNRPMKTIVLNGEPYLERYYMGTWLGRQVWLHRFLRDDAERHVHSHPWTATSWVLAGWYQEMVRPCTVVWSNDGEGRPGALEGFRFILRRQMGSRLKITPDRLHRITLVEPNTWTLMVVQPERRPNWFFLDDFGVITEMKTSERDWWRSAQPRAKGGE